MFSINLLEWKKIFLNFFYIYPDNEVANANISVFSTTKL